MFIKLCPRCGQNKGINFYIRIESPDGKPLHAICKECRDSLFTKNKGFKIIESYEVEN